MTSFNLLRFRSMIIVVLCAAVLVLPYFIVMTDTPVATPVTFLRGLITQRSDLQNPNSTDKFEDLPGLEKMLERTSMPNKTVIITALNGAWASNNTMIDLFLQSFQDGDGIAHLLNHLLIVTLDQTAYDRCIQLHHLCYRVETDGVDFSAEKLFMSGDFLKMMWKRIDFLRVVLELGYNMLFCDSDVMWFRDPFPRFSPDADLQITCDRYNGNPTDLNNPPNTGFLYVRSNNRTINFYKLWFESRKDYPEKNDQNVLDEIKRTEAFVSLGLKVEFLDTLYFAGFCQPSRDFVKVCTMHANCCTSLERKLSDLRLTVADWRRFRSMTEEEKKTENIFWRAPQECRNSW